jgi:hypothetical protein
MNLSITKRMRIALILSLIFVVILSHGGCDENKQSAPTTIQAPPVGMIKEGTVIATITTPQDFSDLLRREGVILHFDADWSLYSVQSRTVVAELSRAIAEDRTLAAIKLRRIDITHQDSPLLSRVSDYLESQNADRSLMTTGGGAIAWIQSGTVVDSIHAATTEGLPKLMERSRRAFGLDAEVQTP